MLKKFDFRIIWGGLLIFAGGLFLIQEIGLIPNAWGLIWAALFGAMGVVFLLSYFSDRSQWWPLIPGFVLLSLGFLILFDTLFPGNSWTGAVFLGGIGLAFWFIYLLNMDNWWAMIPGGVMMTLAVVAGIDPYVKGDLSGGIFMLGTGLTFVFVGLIPTPHGRMSWAFIPALVLLLIGIFLVIPTLSILKYVWPVLLIIVGGYFMVRNLRAG